MRGVFIKMPEELIDLLDALAPHVGEIHPARQGRTSVILWLAARNTQAILATAQHDPAVQKAWSNLLQSREESP